VLNAGNDGYYVAALDPGGLERSIAARAALEPIELLGLIADLRALVRMGAFQLGDALRLTEPLLAGADPALRKSILDLERQARVYARDDQLEALDRVLLARGGAAARALGVMPREGDSPDVVELRRGLLGFLGGEVGDRELSAMAVAPLRRWLTDRSGIDRADLYWIPPLAARHGDAELLAALETVGRNAAVPDQEVVAYTIPAFGDPELVRKGYQWMMAGGLSDEVLTWVHTGGRYPGREARRAVFEEHLDALIARTPAEQQVWLIRVAGWNICDAEGAPGWSASTGRGRRRSRMAPRPTRSASPRSTSASPSRRCTSRGWVPGSRAGEAQVDEVGADAADEQPLAAIAEEGLDPAGGAAVGERVGPAVGRGAVDPQARPGVVAQPSRRPRSTRTRASG
jgi:hypothetical protein